jgi:hypothetical protein
MLLPDPCHSVRGRLSSPTSRSTCQAPPHVLMLRTQAVGVKSCRPRSGLLTWHPSASTADSLLETGSIKRQGILGDRNTTRQAALRDRAHQEREHIGWQGTLDHEERLETGHIRKQSTQKETGHTVKQGSIRKQDRLETGNIRRQATLGTEQTRKGHCRRQSKLGERKQYEPGSSSRQSILGARTQYSTIGADEAHSETGHTRRQDALGDGAY